MILDSEQVNPSPATLFHFFDESEKLSDPTSQMEKLWEETSKEYQEGKYVEFNYEIYQSDSGRIFEVLINEKLKHNNSIVIFSFTEQSHFSNSTIYIAIDMSYVSEEQMEEEGFYSPAWF